MLPQMYPHMYPQEIRLKRNVIGLLQVQLDNLIKKQAAAIDDVIKLFVSRPIEETPDNELYTPYCEVKDSQALIDYTLKQLIIENGKLWDLFQKWS